MRPERKKVEKKVKKKAVEVGDATLTEESVVVETTAVLTETKEAKVSFIDIEFLFIQSFSKHIWTSIFAVIGYRLSDNEPGRNFVPIGVPFKSCEYFTTTSTFIHTYTYIKYTDIKYT